MHPIHLPPSTFSSPDTVRLARELVGRQLVLADPQGRETARHTIVETEAYDGPDDRASHARNGPTPRSAVMFGPPGHWYVYLVYGMHEMLNLVTGPAGYPAAVLIRGLDSVSGPGRLTKTLGIGRRFNGLPAAPAHGLYLAEAPVSIPPHAIEATPRIGVDYAGPHWASRPYRFILRQKTFS